MALRPRTVGIAGAGTMGIGIAQSCAMSGSSVLVYDPYPSSLERAMTILRSNLDQGVERGKLTAQEANDAFERVSIIETLEELVADIIIEAIPEDLRLKQDLFMRLEKVNSMDSVFATNTSSIPVGLIASVLDHPGRMLGIHFFNPAHIMKLVEVISGDNTNPVLTVTVKEWISTLGKVPVLANDRPGFIVNRVARPYYTESLKAVEDGISDPATIDDLLQSTGFRMGPFKLMDLIGVDVNYAVTCSVFEQFRAERFRPSPVQDKLVKNGWHGKKSGKGFYKYED